MTVPAQRSAVWALDVAIAAVIDAEHARTGAALGALLNTPAVYSGEARAPDGGLIPLEPAYIVLGASQERDTVGSAFRKPRRENLLSLDIWTADTSKATGMRIYQELARLLNAQTLALANYGTVRLGLELVLSLPDPSRAAYHVTCRVRVLSFPPPASPGGP